MNKYIIDYIDLDGLICSMRKIPGKKDTYIVTPEDFKRNVIELIMYGNSKNEVMFKFFSKLPSDKYMFIRINVYIRDWLKNWFWNSLRLPIEVAIEKTPDDKIKVKYNDLSYIVFTPSRDRDRPIFAGRITPIWRGRD